MILGVDVHAGYGSIDWHRVAAAGVRFGIAKCSVGNEPEQDDSSFTRNVAGMKAAGIIPGAYHFAFPLRSGPGRPKGRSPKEQAERFFEVSKGLGASAGELPPALDFEWPARWDKRHVDEDGRLIDQWQYWDVDAAFLNEWGLEMLEALVRLWGVVPLVYEYPDFRTSLGKHGLDSRWTRSPLWIATYPNAAMHAELPPAHTKPILRSPWEDWAIWQFSADGSSQRIDGIPACPIDRNVMRDEETLRRLARLDDKPTAPSIPAAEIIHPDVPLGRPALDE